MDALDISVALRRKGFTQTSVATLLEVPISTVNAVIHGETRSRRTAEFIAGIVGRNLHDIWPGVYNYKPRTRSSFPLPKVAA